MPTFALLPAAGKSARMGTPKLALPLGERTVLERVLDTLRSARVDDVLVVLGPHVAALRAMAEKAGAHVMVLDQETADMRSTVACGLDWLETNRRPRADDAFLLLPPDHPALSTEAIDVLLRARSVKESRATIWVPTFEGKRGHPALIGWNHVAGIRAVPEGRGLNAYLREHLDETQEVACSAADILCDLDTPGDYESLRRRNEGGQGISDP
jgi:molybdenum cofactor cytidylyltransferase